MRKRKYGYKMSHMRSPHYRFDSNPPPGYSPRVWIQRTHLTKEIRQKLDTFSCWGGCDKSTEDRQWFSWEVPANRTKAAREYLQSQGLNEYSYSKPVPTVGCCKACGDKAFLDRDNKSFLAAVKHVQSGASEPFMVDSDECFTCYMAKLKKEREVA